MPYLAGYTALSLPPSTDVASLVKCQLAVGAVDGEWCCEPETEKLHVGHHCCSTVLGLATSSIHEHS